MDRIKEVSCSPLAVSYRPEPRHPVVEIIRVHMSDATANIGHLTCLKLSS